MKINMLKRAKLILAGLLTLAVLLPPAAVLADCANPATTQEAIQCGTNGASGGTTKSTAQATDSFNNIVSTLLNILTVLVGVVAVIMIVLAGYRFITSGGNAEKVKSARNALLYAIIGIVIAALAQVIAQFVINRSVSSGNTPPSQSTGSVKSK